MKTSLKNILLDYINAEDTFVSKGQLGLIAEQHGYFPESVGRLLRSMAESTLLHKPEIEVSYYKGKRKQLLSRYGRIGTVTPQIKKPRMVERNGVMYIIGID